MRAPEAIDAGSLRRPARFWPMLTGFSIVLALALLGPIMTINDASRTGEGNPLREAIYLVGLVLIVVGVRPIRYPRRLLTLPLALVLALAWCWLSLAWAIEPGIALRRLILTTLVIWSIFVSVPQLNYEVTLRTLRIALVLTLIANFAAVLVMPAIGIHQASDSLDPGLIGNWRGIMMQKNFAGLTCALTLIVFIIDARRIGLAIRLPVIAATLFFLFETQSRTSWGAVLAAIAVGLVFLRYDARYRAVLLPFLIVALVAGAAALTFYDPVDDRLNNNAALTGRPEIWDMLFRFSADNRLLGSGYGSFWDIGGSSPVYHYGHGWVTALAAGHSGFIDMLVAVGVPGLLLIVYAVIVWPISRLLTSPEASNARGALLMTIIVFCLAHNMTETSLFDRDSIGQVFLMIAIALLGPVTGAGAQRGRPVRRALPPPGGAPFPTAFDAAGNGTFPLPARAPSTLPSGIE